MRLMLSMFPFARLGSRRPEGSAEVAVVYKESANGSRTPVLILELFERFGLQSPCARDLVQSDGGYKAREEKKSSLDTPNRAQEEQRSEGISSNHFAAFRLVHFGCIAGAEFPIQLMADLTILLNHCNHALCEVV